MRWRARGGALLAGAFPALAFPEGDQWWLAWCGLVPLLVLVVRAPSRREAVVRAWIGGFAYFVTVHHWLVPNAGPFLIVAAIALGALWTLWAAILWTLLADPQPRRVAAAIVLVPAAWVVAEYVRSWEGLGGPFGLLGSSQWNAPATLSLASLGGVWAVSFVAVGVNVALTTATLPAVTSRMRVTMLGIAAAMTVLGPVWWLVRAEPRPTRTLQVAGVQPGVIRPVARRFAASEEPTLALRRGTVDLVVWGESSLGLNPRDHPTYQRRLEDAADAVGSDLLVNVDVRNGPGGILKATLLVGPDGTKARYTKQRLVPFGEYIPLRPILGWVQAVTSAPAVDRRRGSGLEVFETSGIKVGPLICFESAFPDLTRGLVRRGADVVVMQTADWTFQGSWGPEHHASVAAVRAVETGRSVLQATLTGVSAAFDPTGRRLLWLDTDRRGAYHVDLPVVSGTTLYVRLGDWVPFGGAVVLLGAGTLALVRRAHVRRSPR